MVSHNLRGPLANIIGFTELLNHGSTHPNDLIEITKYLSEAAYKLDEVIRDMNTILRGETPIVESAEQVYFDDIVKEISSDFDTLIKDKFVTIKTDFKRVDNMFTVKKNIQSIFYNLISNSIKFKKAEANVLIEIESQKTTNGLILTFKDNGLGIDLEKNGKKLFGLYKRFHLNIKGKGMGLFMVKRLVESLGGKISLISQANVGTEIIIAFENN